jgi:hypothetical protein
MDSKALLNCPFCGAKPKLGMGQKGHCQLHGEPFQPVTIKCSNGYCIASGGVSVGDVYNGGHQAANDKARKKWNQRADDNHYKAALEKARQELDFSAKELDKHSKRIAYMDCGEECWVDSDECKQRDHNLALIREIDSLLGEGKR